MVDLWAPGGCVRTLHDSPDFFVVRALGDCQHLSKSDYLPKSISSNSASTSPLFRLFCPPLHTDVNQLLAETECGGPAVLRSFTSRKPFTNRHCSIFPLQPFFAGHSFFTLSLCRVSSSLATNHTRLPTAALVPNR
jgi:hypothetical protein